MYRLIPTLAACLLASGCRGRAVLDAPAALADLFTALGQGDPVAWGGVGLFALIAGGLGLFVLKTRRDLEREDEARAKRHGRR